MDGGGFSRHLDSVLNGPRFSVHQNQPRVADMSFLWVGILPHVIGDPVWAQKFVQDLPSQQELLADGAPGDWDLEQLVKDARKAIWDGGEDSITLRHQDILTVDGDKVDFSSDLQIELDNRLSMETSFRGAVTWIQNRFKASQQVHFSMHYCTLRN
jgi:hypothetical protein